MKLVTLAIMLMATVGLVASAQPHHHHHHHAQKRAPTPVEDVIVPGPVVTVYELNGHMISDQDVQEGIKNGSLVFATGTLSSVFTAPATSSTSHPRHTHSSESVSVESSSAVVISTSSAAVSTAAPVTTAAPSTTSEVVSLTNSTSSVEVATTSSSISTTSSALAVTTEVPSSGSSGVNTEFPDGELDCSTFPSDYGAVSLPYLGIGGWAGIQQPGSDLAGFSDILTVTSAVCSDGSCCGEGAYCSYACPPGYQKSQWPSTQGATGQSVGGIMCLDGKLRLTNPSLSKNLCVQGTTAVSVMVQNTMYQGAVVCRTDYPGTESETIPLNAEAGTTMPLTCPSASDYYTWKGMSTSAQYYVNPAGVPVEDACQWGTPDQDWGNYAPMNLGVGYSDGSAWLSIFQNSPTTEAKLDFNVELVGDDGGYDNLNGRCMYRNGQYCSGDNYEDCSPTTGCTVSVVSGTATYVFSSSS